MYNGVTMTVLIGVKNWIETLPEDQVNREKVLAWAGTLDRESQLWLVAHKDEIKLPVLKQYSEGTNGQDDKKETPPKDNSPKKTMSTFTTNAPKIDRGDNPYQLNDYAKNLLKQLNNQAK